MINNLFEIKSYEEFIGTLDKGYHVVLGEKDKDCVVPRIVGVVISMVNEETQTTQYVLSHVSWNKNIDPREYEYRCITKEIASDMQFRPYTDEDLSAVYHVLETGYLYGVFLNNTTL